jgi:copper oxidase (laccase) domain-containing protein
MQGLLYAESNTRDGNLSLRLEDEASVLPKRELFLSRSGISSEDCVFIDTEHGDKITHVGISDKRRLIPTEALITKDAGVALYLLTADCFPVSFFDPKLQVVALAHMGWKPTDKQLARKVIQEMGAVYGSQPENIEVIIGPGIHKESYIFTNPLQKNLPPWSRFLINLPRGETAIDILGYIQDQATGAGVLQENIHASLVDTATSKEHFSHYRSVRTGEPEGRFATVVGLANAPLATAVQIV